MDGDESRPLGRRREVRFEAAQIDIAAAVDLLIVGMHDADLDTGSGGGADQIDGALQGTLGRLRTGDIFRGDLGETLILAKPPKPIGARSLLLVGMGPVRSSPGVMGRLTWLAMGEALRNGVGSAACLLGWAERDLPPEEVPVRAAEMMWGALRAIDDHAARAEIAPMRWIFDIRNGEVDRMATALRLAFEAWK
jgi:hypothetical protein